MKFLIAIHRHNHHDPSTEGPEMAKAIDDLNDEMRVAGARIMAMGIHHIDQAISLTQTESNEVEERKGRYLIAEEHMSGFWILECQDLQEAIEWGKKAVVACRANVEVRQFF
jgi:hypothetical protein